MTDSDDPTYIGTELELFTHAKNWKTYLGKSIRPHVGTRILEVGAGLGGTTGYLIPNKIDSWTCLEPDPTLAHQIPGSNPERDDIRVIVGQIADIETGASFDTLIYIDVLEHIEDDRKEVESAWKRLEPGGRLIVLSPAYDWLMSEFDHQIGHFRRYSRKSLSEIIPANSALERVRYLDSVGLLASLANKTILRSGSPTYRQIAFWDNILVPLSRWIDPVVQNSFGKSILGVWRKTR